LHTFTGGQPAEKFENHCSSLITWQVMELLGNARNVVHCPRSKGVKDKLTNQDVPRCYVLSDLISWCSTCFAVNYV